MRTYHKKNCGEKLRKSTIDKFGRKISLVGQHAFDWAVLIEDKGKLSSMEFPRREKAQRYFNLLKGRKS